MRFLTAASSFLLCVAVAPAQGQLLFPAGIDAGWNDYQFRGAPDALVVLAVALDRGTTTVVLGPTLLCRLELAPAFTVVPLGTTDVTGRLDGSVSLPVHWMFSLQAVACPLPPAVPQLQTSNAVHYVFQGCWGGGATSGG